MSTETFLSGGTLATGSNGEILVSSGPIAREEYIGGALLPVDENNRLVVSGDGIGTPGSGTSDHALLTNRDAPAQHPASAIAAVDGKSVQEHVDLLAKATVQWDVNDVSRPGTAVRVLRNVAADNFLTVGVFTTGTIKITLPFSWIDGACVIDISGYESSNNGEWKIRVSGTPYRYSPVGWMRYNAYIVSGNIPFNRVRLGHDGEKVCILLGENTSLWRFVSICIDKAILYNIFPSLNLNAGWKIEVITDESNITNIVEVPIQGSTTGTVAHAPYLLDRHVEIDEFVQLSKTTEANLYNHLLTHCPEFVREISATHFGFNP